MRKKTEARPHGALTLLTWLAGAFAAVLLITSLLAVFSSFTGIGAEHDGAWFSPRRTEYSTAPHEGPPRLVCTGNASR